MLLLFVRKEFKLFLRILPFYNYVFKIKKYKNIEFKKQKNEIKVKNNKIRKTYDNWYILIFNEIYNI
jgi:hypothetical protein